MGGGVSVIGAFLPAGLIMIGINAVTADEPAAEEPLAAPAGEAILLCDKDGCALVNASIKELFEQIRAENEARKAFINGAKACLRYEDGWNREICWQAGKELLNDRLKEALGRND